jgi:hypothetical protein
MSTGDAAQFMNDVLGMWTEADPEARRVVLEKHFAEDVRFNDPDGAVLARLTPGGRRRRLPGLLELRPAREPGRGHRDGLRDLGRRAGLISRRAEG